MLTFINTIMVLYRALKVIESLYANSLRNRFVLMSSIPLQLRNYTVITSAAYHLCLPIFSLDKEFQKTVLEERIERNDRAPYLDHLPSVAKHYS